MASLLDSFIDRHLMLILCLMFQTKYLVMQAKFHKICIDKFVHYIFSWRFILLILCNVTFDDKVAKYLLKYHLQLTVFSL